VYATNAIYCDSISAAQVTQIQERELVIKELKDEVAVQKTAMEQAEKTVLATQTVLIKTEEALTANENTIKKLSKKIKLLKIERVGYPVLAILGTLYLSIKL